MLYFAIDLVDSRGINVTNFSFFFYSFFVLGFCSCHGHAILCLKCTCCYWIRSIAWSFWLWLPMWNILNHCTSTIPCLIFTYVELSVIDKKKLHDHWVLDMFGFKYLWFRMLRHQVVAVILLFIMTQTHDPLIVHIDPKSLACLLESWFRLQGKNDAPASVIYLLILIAFYRKETSRLGTSKFSYLSLSCPLSAISLFSFAQFVDCGWSDLKIMYRFLHKLCMIDCTSSTGWPTKLFKIM